MKLYAVGYGGRSPKELVSLLSGRGIRSVVDVRLRPDRASMGSYALAKDPARGIQGLLIAAGIQYFSFIELGNLFIDRPNWAERYQRLVEQAGDLLIERLASVPEPFCLMCAEKRAADCHRSLIAAHLVSRGHGVEHIE